MRIMWMMALLLSGSFLLAQDSNSEPTKNSKGQLTVQGCVSRSSGDYVLVKQDPAVSYQLQGTGKIKLRHYLGERVEVTGNEGPTMSTSSDAMNKVGSAAPETLTITSIKILDKECSVRNVSR
ncbi:MAG TPA: hypothetical protein VGZ91_18175 [Candidatus Sulfotelmatobacter sp.]|jgi:hypothetical protein|nr:hypothetical protein [Candidatus Sulfotelmatobacter sp.]